MNLLSRILRRGFGFPAHLRSVEPVDSRDVKGQVFIPFTEPCDCDPRWHSPHCDRYERRAGGMGREFEEWRRPTLQERMAKIHESVTDVEERGRCITASLRMSVERPEMASTIANLGMALAKVNGE